MKFELGIEIWEVYQAEVGRRAFQGSAEQSLRVWNSMMCLNNGKELSEGQTMEENIRKESLKYSLGPDYQGNCMPC